MKKIRVAFFAEMLIRDFDGASRTIFEIIDRIDPSRFEFLFFCGVPPTENIDWEVFETPTLTIPFNEDYKMAWTFGVGSKIQNRLNRFSPDIIHISTPSRLGNFALKYALNNHIPTTTIYHTHFISYISYYTKNIPILTQALEAVVKRQYRSFYNKCDKIYVPTDAMSEELKTYGFDKNRMSIWPRGIKLDLFRPEQADDNWIKQITKNEKKNILFVSRLVWEKNLETLIDIYESIQKEDLPYNLIIAGSGVAEKELKERMPHAFFLGNLNHERLAVLYASCDYFTFTSVTETFGNVIIEAMASGTPVLIADGGGSRSLVSQGISGFLCKPYTAKDYLDNIQLLEEQPELRTTMIRQALKEVKQLSWEKLVHRLMNDYVELSSPNITKKISA